MLYPDVMLLAPFVLKSTTILAAACLAVASLLTCLLAYLYFSLLTSPLCLPLLCLPLNSTHCLHLCLPLHDLHVCLPPSAYLSPLAYHCSHIICSIRYLISLLATLILACFAVT